MEELWQIEANIDDMNPQDMEYVFEQLLSCGVNDVWAMPMLMKKSRMASMLCVLCRQEILDTALDIIFRETTTIGVRYFSVMRQICERVMKEVVVENEKIHVKISSRDGEIMMISAEYDDCRAVALKTGIPLAEWRRKAIEEAYRQYGHNPK